VEAKDGRNCRGIGRFRRAPNLASGDVARRPAAISASVCPKVGLESVTAMRLRDAGRCGVAAGLRSIELAWPGRSEPEVHIASLDAARSGATGQPFYLEWS